MFLSLTLSFRVPTFCRHAQLRTPKKLRRRHNDTHRRNAVEQSLQLFSHSCCPDYITCILASMLMAVACECTPYWLNTGEYRVRCHFCVLFTAISRFAAVVSPCAFLPHLPILFQCSSCKSSLHNTRTLQDSLLQFLATTTYCRIQNLTVDTVFVHFWPFQHWNHRFIPRKVSQLLLLRSQVTIISVYPLV